MEPNGLIVGARPAGAAAGAPRPMAGKSCYRLPGASPHVGGYCGWRCWHFCIAEDRAFQAFCHAGLCVKMTYNDTGHASSASGMASSISMMGISSRMG